MTTSMTVLCVSCNIPGRVTVDSDGKIKSAFFVCKCPRPSLKEANA
jgi:hypothetical protein